MKSHLKYIAVLDNQDKIHSVSFNTGVNVITGKSSTGKSAMIEIFDYCFGNSINTVPSGIITNSARLYFIVLSLKSTFLILARDPLNKKVFLKEENTLPELSKFRFKYFNSDFFIPMKDFREELGRCFGIDIKDTDVDLEDKKYRYQNAKSPRPSARHFTSFMLQHQNLVANKHSLFYRFDENQKREQTIDQFKIFSSFVSQDYFTKKQQLNELERELKKLETKQELITEQRKEKELGLNNLLIEYVAVTGKKLIEETSEVVLRNPAQHLENIKYLKVITELESNENAQQLDRLDQELNKISSEKREIEFELNNINASIRYAEEYKNGTEDTKVLSEASLHLSECPFCKTQNEELVAEANNLEKAINWLNTELSNSNTLLDSFLPEQKATELKIKAKNKEAHSIFNKAKQLRKIVDDLKKNKSIEEQGLKIKLKIETLLEDKINVNSSDLEIDINEKKGAINILNKELNSKYNPEKELKKAEQYINAAMNKIGRKLNFEDSYNPINLKFSLETFDIWHEKNGQKVFLRSMGSGANWLYCHLSLFTALHRYFCSLDDKCLIPPILFLDQPSQVYFPTSIMDEENEFNPEELKKKEGKEKMVDEDILAVTNFYEQLVTFCKETLEETGIEPQIIITDHADKLKLDNVDFNDLVEDRRWRTRGFIDNNTAI